MSKIRKENLAFISENSEVDSDLGNNLLFENRIATERAVSLGDLKWMTTIEAAQYLRVSVGSIKNMVYRGMLSPRKLGRLNRFLRDDLDRAISLPAKGGY
ncbi:MAG: helix-turn-helix domain-containing protein [Bdellovibrionales bacterium]|nr:helix-turn-helix domain-containing protein [Bdellovibrionales bacterium]